MKKTIKVGRRKKVAYHKKDLSDTDHDGIADGRNNTIHVHHKLRGRRELIIDLHEVMHLAKWKLEEPFVEKLAEACGDALWQLGWRSRRKC